MVDMNPWLQLAVVWLGAAIAMTAGWWWQRRHANAGIVDAIWASGIGAAADVPAYGDAA